MMRLFPNFYFSNITFIVPHLENSAYKRIDIDYNEYTEHRTAKHINGNSKCSLNTVNQ